MTRQIPVTRVPTLETLSELTDQQRIDLTDLLADVREDESAHKNDASKKSKSTHAQYWAIQLVQIFILATGGLASYCDDNSCSEGVRITTGVAIVALGVASMLLIEWFSGSKDVNAMMQLTISLFPKIKSDITDIVNNNAGDKVNDVIKSIKRHKNILTLLEKQGKDPLVRSIHRSERILIGV